LTPTPNSARPQHQRRRSKKTLEATVSLTVTTATDKQGSTLVRWAAIEACQRTRPGTKLAADRTRIIANRGRNIGVVAAARKLLTYVYYGLRDGEIRALAKGAA
jgi:hypothetical protein